MKRFAPRLLLTLCLLAPVAGCSSAYYSTMETFGYEKRDLLTDRVQDARDDQAKASKQFQTTLDRFKEVTNFNGGDLESKYNKLKSDYEKAEARANDVKTRIKKVETVAADMFAEWKKELSEYSDQNLRRSSQEKLDATRERYNQLISLMKSSSAKMDPVLKVFSDHVLYLKHNLNAAAISSLSGTATKIDADVQSLIRDLQASIQEADAFISTMKQ